MKNEKNQQYTQISYQKMSKKVTKHKYFIKLGGGQSRSSYAYYMVNA